MKRKTDNFSKFIGRKKNGAVKEAIKQEKRVEKKERQQAIEKRFQYDINLNNLLSKYFQKIP